MSCFQVQAIIYQGYFDVLMICSRCVDSFYKRTNQVFLLVPQRFSKTQVRVFSWGEITATCTWRHHGSINGGKNMAKWLTYSPEACICMVMPLLSYWFVRMRYVQSFVGWFLSRQHWEPSFFHMFRAHTSLQTWFGGEMTSITYHNRATVHTCRCCTLSFMSIALD